MKYVSQGEWQSDLQKGCSEIMLLVGVDCRIEGMTFGAISCLGDMIGEKICCSVRMICDKESVCEQNGCPFFNMVENPQLRLFSHKNIEQQFNCHSLSFQDAEENDKVLLIFNQLKKERAYGIHPPILTSRELEVLSWFKSGKNCWETATILGISERTIHFHVANAKKKLGAVTREQAVANAILQKMI